MRSFKHMPVKQVDINNIVDPEIAAYLKKNPTDDYSRIGKFGLPQDKYRWNFYGSSTFEYDSWGRNKK